MVVSYAQYDMLMPKSRDVFGWTAIIGDNIKEGRFQEALNSFDQMRHEGLSPDGVTFACILKACGSIKAAKKGDEIHDEIAKQGLLANDLVLGNALIDMYAKCGALAKAQQVLAELPVRDVVSWTTLIAGYAQEGESVAALLCFERMQCEGLSPNPVTMISILKACGRIKALGKGQSVHVMIASQGFLGTNLVLGNVLLDMYAKCGAFAKARRVLEELPIRNVISWTALIAGYEEQGQHGQAMNAFEHMLHDGISPNAVTFTCMLKACGSIRAADKGKKIHDEIAKQGLLGTDIVLGNALVDMYTKCGAFVQARQLLEEMPKRNVNSWNALMAGYIQLGQAQQVLDCFESMRRDGLSPDAATFSYALNACASIRAIDKGQEIHDDIAKRALLGQNVVLGNSLVNMYTKCGVLAKARRVLEELPVRNVVCWSALIEGYVEQGEGQQALDCFEWMQQEGLFPNAVTYIYVLKACGSIRAADKLGEVHEEIAKQGYLFENIQLGNALISTYAKFGALRKAQAILEELPIRDVFSWNALIGGYVEGDQAEQALNCFEKMRCEGVPPDAVTFTCILKACGSTGATDMGEKIHHDIVKQGILANDIVLGTAVVDMYAKCGALVKAWQVLERLPVRDAISWNALIAVHAERGDCEQVMHCLEQMRQEGLSPDEATYASILVAYGNIGATEHGEQIHDEIFKQGMMGTDVVLGNMLVIMYAKCGALAKARQMLEELPVKDITSWNALIAGYAQQCEFAQALNCFEQMQRDGLSADAATLTCILKACGSIGAADKGEKIYNEFVKTWLLPNDIMVGNALVDMYAKCGALTRARQVLEELPIRNVISWTALIAGYVRKCELSEALNCLENMHCEGLTVDATTFSCVLSACSRLSLVEQAQTLFTNLRTEYTREPTLEHYVCMVDLLGRIGHLNKAIGIVENIPACGNGVWSALLGACLKWQDVIIGRWAFDCAIQIDKKDVAAYVLMSNIYIAADMQEDAQNIKAMRLGAT